MRQLRLTMLVVLTIICATTSPSMRAQSTLYSPGHPTNSTFFPVENGYINLANGNLHLEIPIATHQERGKLVNNYRLVYDSSIWHGVPLPDGSNQWEPTNVPNSMGGWRYEGATDAQLSNSDSSATSSCSSDPGTNVSIMGPFIMTESDGTVHTFPIKTIEIAGLIPGCVDPTNPDTPTGAAYAVDGSGYYATVSDYNAITVYNKQGTMIISSNVGPQQDSNGNYQGGTQDDLGRTIVTTSENGATTTYSVLTVGGQREPYTITTEDLSVYTHFISDSVGTDFNGTITVVKSLGLPDGTSYQFSYEQPDPNGRSEGELTGITLPTGGQVTYEYLSGLNGTRAGADVPARWVAQHVGADGTTTFSIIPIDTCTTTTCVYEDNYVTRNGVTTDYSYYLTKNNGLYNSSIITFTSAFTETYPASSASTNPPVPRYESTYNYYTPGDACPAIVCPNNDGTETIFNVPSNQLTFFDDTGLATYTTYGYSTDALQRAGMPDSVKQWDYYTLPAGGGNSAPTTAPTSETDYQYIAESNGVLLPNQVTVKDGSGTIQQMTQLVYDEASHISPSSGVPNHNAVTGNRGDVTTVKTYRTAAEVSASAPSVITGLYYDDAGVLLKQIDPNGNPTILGYDPTDTFVTTITRPPTGSVMHISQRTYDENTGQVKTSTDENNQVTHYNYDAIGRLQSVVSPDTSSATYSYPSATETDITSQQSSTVTVAGSAVRDVYGRPSIETSGGISQQTTYDSSGRVNCVFNPYQSGSSSTDGTTCNSYDFLNRITRSTNPDQTYSGISYVDNVVTVTDELNKNKSMTYDSRGNLVQVMEPDSSGALNWETDYQYDILNRLTGIKQKGGQTDSSQWRQRAFTYDFLRLLSISEPESGTTAFTQYDANGNVKGVQNAHGDTVTLAYDALNRLISKTLSTGSSYTYTYDGADSSGDPFPVGQLTSFVNGSTTGARLKHDINGNVASESYCLPSGCSYAPTVQAQYDYDGNMTSLTYPDGRSVTMAYDLADRMTGATYASWGGQIVNVPYVSNISYYPPGEVMAASLGNGIQMSAGVNPRQDIQSLVYQKSGEPRVSKTYTWDKNGSNLDSILDNVTGTLRTFDYDNVNRLSTAVDTVNSGGTGPGIPGSGSVTINGREQAVSKTICGIVNGVRRCTPTTVYDTGTVSVSVGSTTESVDYGGASSGATIASGLAAAFNAATGSPVTASANGNELTLMATAIGSGSDYAISASVTTSDTTDFPTPSFSTSDSGGSLTGGGTGNLLSEQYSIDPWGNLKQSGNFSFIQNYGTNNQIAATGYGYDNAGRLTSDGLGDTYSYDSENKMIASNQATYTYDPLGQRIRKDSNGSLEYYYFNGSLLATQDPSTPTSWMDYIYGAGRLIAENPGPSLSAAATFRMGDHLDSLIQTTDAVGDPLDDARDFSPYGQLVNGAATDRILFTDDEYDSENATHHTTFRQMSPAQGRWVSPDPYTGSYNLADPQSLNRYAYLSNRTLASVDLLGLQGGDGDGGGSGGGGGDGGLFGILINLGVNELFNWLFDGGPQQNLNYAHEVRVNDDAPDEEPIKLDYTLHVDANLFLTQTASPLNLPSNAQIIIPDKLIPSRYKSTFDKAYLQALKRLASRSCSQLYGGQGPATMASTQYEVVKDGGPDVGADTTPMGSRSIVRLNSSGPMYDYQANAKYFTNWKGGFRGGADVGSVFILHELGHELVNFTHFYAPDAGAANAAKNAANTQRVLENCF